MKIYVVFNTSDSQSHDWQMWIDSTYTDHKTAVARLDAVRKANGYRWASPHIVEVETDIIKIDGHVRTDKP